MASVQGMGGAGDSALYVSGRRTVQCGARALMAVLPPGTVLSSRPVKGIDGATEWMVLEQGMWPAVGVAGDPELGEEVCKPRAGMLLYLVNGHVDVRAGSWAHGASDLGHLVPGSSCHMSGGDGDRTPPDCWEHLNLENTAGKDRTMGTGTRGAREDPVLGVGPPAVGFPFFLSLKMRPSSQEWVAGAAGRIPTTQAGGIWLGGLKECLRSLQLSVHTKDVLAVSSDASHPILCQACGFQQSLLSL